MLSALLWISEWHNAAKHFTWYTDTGWWMSVTANPVACSTQYLHQLRLMLPSLSSPAAMVYEPSIHAFLCSIDFLWKNAPEIQHGSHLTRLRQLLLKKWIFKSIFFFLVQSLVMLPVTFLWMDLLHLSHFLDFFFYSLHYTNRENVFKNL